MSREEFLRKRIKSLGNMKAFAEKIDMPYTTLRSILTNVGGASLDNVLKICKGLSIPIDELDPARSNNWDYQTPQERNLMDKFRKLSQPVKDTIESVVNVQYEAAQEQKEQEIRQKVDSYETELRAEKNGDASPSQTGNVDTAKNNEKEA